MPLAIRHRSILNVLRAIEMTL